MHLGTILHTWLFGKFVGRDEAGNRYYQGTRKNEEGRVSRWVVYSGVAEPSKVPPHWHGWLHYTTDKAPLQQSSKRYVWQKDPLPNFTGTQLAYRPSGSALRGGERAPSSSDYEAWKPE